MQSNLSYNIIQTNYHLLKSVAITKTALSAYDNKRYYLNMIESLPFGHKDTHEILKKNLTTEYLS